MFHLLWCSSISKSLNCFHRPSFTGTATERPSYIVGRPHMLLLCHTATWTSGSVRGWWIYPIHPTLLTVLRWDDKFTSVAEGTSWSFDPAAHRSKGPHTSVSHVVAVEQNKRFPRCPKSCISNNCLVRIFLVPVRQVETKAAKKVSIFWEMLTLDWFFWLQSFILDTF